MSQYSQARRIEIMKQSFELRFCAVHKIMRDEIVPADVLCAINCSPGCNTARIGACQFHYEGFFAGGVAETVCVKCGGTPHVSEPVRV